MLYLIVHALFRGLAATAAGSIVGCSFRLVPRTLPGLDQTGQQRAKLGALDRQRAQREAERATYAAPRPSPPRAWTSRGLSKCDMIEKPEAWPLWLGKEPAEPAELKGLLSPFPSDEMTCWPVSPWVGKVRNHDPSLIELIAA